MLSERVLGRWRCLVAFMKRHRRCHDATSVVTTARHGFSPSPSSLLLIVVCCLLLLLSASTVAIVVTNATSTSASAIITVSSASTVSASLAALTVGNLGYQQRCVPRFGPQATHVTTDA